ncbi:MAG: NAD-dependent epimerase/dehydratase family protein [Culicoidibacterales bacterium]
MKIILIGGAGFIGSHIAEGYVKAGHDVIVVDDLSTGKKENIQHLIDEKKIKLYETSILNYADLEQIFSDFQPEIINNHAAQKSVPNSVEDPVKDNNINILGVFNLIKLAHKYGVKKFISASSGGALSKEITINGEKSKEEDIPQLISPYAITKYASEKYLKLYANMYGFDYIGLRYANVFGPRQAAEGDCGVIPIFVNNILANKPSILMTYDDMPNGCTRDYIYVADLVDFNVKVLDCNDNINDVFNLGLSKEFSIGEIYNGLINAFAVKLPLIKQGPRLGDVKRSVLDCTKVLKALDFSPKVSMEEGISRLVAHYMSNNH